MTFDPSLFQQSSTYFASDQVYVSDGKSLNIEKIGSTTLCTPSTKMKLNDVSLVPELSRNLLYVAQLTRDNDYSIDSSLRFLRQGSGCAGSPSSKVWRSKVFIQFRDKNGTVWS